MHTEGFGHEEAAAQVCRRKLIQIQVATMRHSVWPVPLILSSMIALHAQDRVVQQPVVRQFRVGTSVSVPDRGRALLGGISQGATGTRRFGGPLRSGTNSGREFSNSSQSVSVYIHDFDAMDTALLNAADESASGSRFERPLHSRAASAWESLRGRRPGRR